MKNTMLRLFCILLGLLALAQTGCQVGKKGPVDVHEGPATPAPGGLSPEAAQDLQPDSSFRLSADYFVVHRNLKDPEFTRNLEATNKAILAGDSKQLSEFKALILTGCIENSLQDCTYLKLFARSHLSTQVLLRLQKMEPNLDRQRQLLLMAFEVSNGRPDIELVSRALQFSAQAAAQYLSDKDGRLQISEKGKASFKDHLRLTTMVFYAVSQVPGQRDSRKNVIEANLPSAIQWLGWTHFLNSTEILGKDLMALILNVLQMHKTHPLVRAAQIDFIQNHKNGFEYSLANFRTRLALKVENSVDANIAEFFVDYIANDQEQTAMALMPHGFSGRSAEVGQAIQNWLTLSIQSQALVSHQKMGQFLLDYEKQKKTREQLFQQVLLFSQSDLSTAWARLTTALTRLRAYTTKNFRDPDLTAMQYLFSNVSKNISYLSSYPQMIGLALYARKLNFSQNIDFGTATVKLSDDRFFARLMNGEVPNLFDYTTGYEGGQNNPALDKPEIRLAWYYFYKQQLPKLYGMSTSESVNYFLKGFVKDYSTNLKDIDQLVTQKQSSREIQDASQLCETLAAARQGREFRKVNRTRALSRLKTQAFYGLSLDQSEAPMDALFALTDLSKATLFKSLDDLLESIRMDIGPGRQDLEAIAKIAAEASQEDLTLQMQLLANLKNFETKTIERIKWLADLSGQCVMDAALIERTQRQNLLNQEIQFLNEVVQIGAKVNGGEMDADAANSLVLSRFFSPRLLEANSEFVSDFHNFAGFAKSASGQMIFRYRPVDFLLRTAAALEHGFPGQIDQVQFHYARSFSGLMGQMGKLSNTPLNARPLEIGAGLVNEALLFLNQELTPASPGGVREAFWTNTESGLANSLRNLNRIDATLVRTDAPEQAVARYENVLRRTLSAVAFFDLQDRNADLFSSLRINSFLGDDSLLGPEHLFYESESKQMLGLMDDFFLNLVAYSTGNRGFYRKILRMETDWDSTPSEVDTELRHERKKHHFMLALEFAKSIRDIERKVYLPITSVEGKKLIRSSARLVIRDLKDAQSFRTWLDEKQRTANLRIKSSFRRGSADYENPALVRDFVLREYDDQIRNFHNSSLNVFRKLESF